MIRALDQWLMDRADRLTTWAQRRGYLLTSMRVHVAGFTLASTIFYAFVRQNPWLMAYVGIVWGAFFIATCWWASKNNDYPESVKRMQRLNARVLADRELPFFRLALLLVWIVGIPVDIFYAWEGNYTVAITSEMANIAPVLVFYAMACFFIGPGEFAKQRQESEIKGGIRNTN